MEITERPVCPHCGSRLEKWQTPEPSTWGAGYQYVCFNDDCSYYQRGWNWMMEKYNVRSSYRYRFNPANGESGPLPVWSPDALKNDIIPEK